MIFRRKSTDLDRKWSQKLPFLLNTRLWLRLDSTNEQSAPRKNSYTEGWPSRRLRKGLDRELNIPVPEREQNEKLKPWTGLRTKSGTLILMNQEKKIEIAREEAFVFRNWSYYDLMTKIEYKAEKAGIELIVV